MSGRATARIRAGHEVLLWGGGVSAACVCGYGLVFCVVIALSRVTRGGLDWLIWWEFGRC